MANPCQNGPNLAEKNPVFMCRAARPRAIATTTAIEATELYGTSAPAGTAGHQRLRVLLPTTWTSAPPGSLRRIASAVHTVFRCVASRKRGGRWARQPSLRAKKRVSQFGLPHPVGAQPSRGESISFLSPAQAAGAPTFCDATESRQRSQPRGLRLLGHPPRLGSESPTEKIRPCAHPP